MTEKQENLITRSPVVVILGHVDHGKTSILDFIKKTKIAEKEAGGITQHIGAYEVEHQGKKITFIDTPGHEAFEAMRSRGAKLADIAILVVAADEGVKSQTKEAISHIKEAGIPFIVALNKIDKTTADPEKTKRDLAQIGVLVESMGGKVPAVNVSAREGTGIAELLEVILLLAEMENLKATISEPSRAVVIESHLDAKRGPTATVIGQQGILRVGQIVGTPSTSGRIKVLENFQGKAISQALPSQPVVLVGFRGVPKIGEQVKVFSSLEKAEAEIAKEQRKQKQDVSIIPSREGSEAEALPPKQIFNLIIKADVLGSLEAIEQVLQNMPQENIVLRILKKEVGEINESDVKLARGGKATLLGFRTKTDAVARKIALRDRIKIKNFEVIYELSQYLREQMKKAMKPKMERIDWGKLKTLLVFLTEKNRQIIGGKIIEGRAKKGVKVEVFRGEEKIGQGRVINLQKNKKDIAEAKKGEEIGILYEGDVKIQENDILVFWTEEWQKGEL